MNRLNGRQSNTSATPCLRERQKELILIGHDTSEEIGMENCARWLKTVLPGLKMDYVPARGPTSSHSFSSCSLGLPEGNADPHEDDLRPSTLLRSGRKL